MQLANAEEYVHGELVRNLGEVLIRCNNVLYIREVQAKGAGREDEGQMDT